MTPRDRSRHSRDRLVDAAAQYDRKWTRATSDSDGEILRPAHARRRRGRCNGADRIGNADVSRGARSAHAPVGIGHIRRQGASSRRRARVTPRDRPGHSRDRLIDAAAQYNRKWTSATSDTDGEILRSAHARRSRARRDRANRIGHANVRRGARSAHTPVGIGYIRRQGASSRRSARMTPRDRPGHSRDRLIDAAAQ